jgi:hypothetical protein
MSVACREIFSGKVAASLSERKSYARHLLQVAKRSGVKNERLWACFVHRRVKILCPVINSLSICKARKLL